MKSILFILFLSWTFVQAAESKTLRSCKIVARDRAYPCAVGKNGVLKNKKEGDGATPTGKFWLKTLYYRADKLSPQEQELIDNLPAQGFKTQALAPEDLWVDDPNSPYYNLFVKQSDLGEGTLPRHENLWREDDLYDIVLVVGYNDAPVVKGKGSAIFIHVVRQDLKGTYLPTEGCIAFSKDDLLEILSRLQAPNKIFIPKSDKKKIVIR